MRIAVAHFFQPCPVPAESGRPALVTTVRDDNYEIEVQGPLIRVTHKRAKVDHTIYVTVYNTCWMIPQGEHNEPSASQVNTEGTIKTKSKPRTVVVKQLPTAD